MLNAVTSLNIDIPEEKMLIYRLTAKKLNGWFKSVSGINLDECGEKK